MFCVIYRSSKRDQTYLYVEKKDDFSRVPEELMKGFGQPKLAMILPLMVVKNWLMPILKK